MPQHGRWPLLLEGLDGDIAIELAGGVGTPRRCCRRRASRQCVSERWTKVASLMKHASFITLYLPSMPNHPIKDPVTWLYPAIEPYSTGRLQVSPIHDLYYEESGNPDGKPVV